MTRKHVSRLWSSINYWRGVFMVWLLAMSIWAPSFVPVGVFMDLRAVFVEDTVSGVPPKILVDREIHKDFLGTYSVTIRSYPENTIVCASPYIIPFPYRADATLPENVDLAWWLFDGKAYDQCEAENLKPGRYRVITYHTVHDPFKLAPWIETLRSEPTISNVFRIFPSDEPIRKNRQPT